VAKIEDLIRQISDEKLRDELTGEVRELKKHKRFGLVFEEHLPEMLRLPKAEKVLRTRDNEQIQGLFQPLSR
jgi:adenine-specific DNA-methyltransferase